MSSNIILWDARVWLEAHYTSKNGLPGFFSQGDYSYAHKNQAENDYKTAVHAAKNSNKPKFASWANAVIDQKFYILQNTSINAYWSELSVKEALDEAIVLRQIAFFKHSSSDDKLATCTVKKRKIVRKNTDKNSDCDLLDELL